MQCIGVRSAGVVVLIGSIGAAVPASAQTTPRQIRLSFSDVDPQTTMGVTWHSDSSAIQFIEYGVSSVSENQVAATVTTALGGALGNVHSVSLTGLSADTTYRYRVGSAGDGWAPMSGNFTFETAPADPCAPFTFVAVGDTRGDDPFVQAIAAILGLGSPGGTAWPQIFDRISMDSPAFTLIAGDLVDDGDEKDQWNDFFNQGTQHYNVFPVMPSFGNHDDGGAGPLENYEHLFTLPQNGAGNEKYYYFVYGNLLVMAFNSDESALFAEEAGWFDQVLTNNPTTWKMFYFHHPVWTSQPGQGENTGCGLYCGHPPNEKGQNPTLINLVDTYDIDVVIASHNHFYERSGPLAGGGSHETGLEIAANFRGTTASAGSWGSLYMVTGGGGATRLPITRMDELFLGLDTQAVPPGQQALDERFHYVRFTISDLQMIMSAVGDDGVVFDSVTINKLDQHRVGTCPGSMPVDVDMDGFNDTVDCDDMNDAIHPGAAEICGDGIDQDCAAGDLACPMPDGGPPSDGGAQSGGDSTVPGGDRDLKTLGDPAGCDCAGATPSWLLVILPALRRRRRGPARRSPGA